MDDLLLDAQAALAVMGQLSDLGLTWQPAAGNCYDPGVPSLMSCVLTDGEDFTEERTYGEVPTKTKEPSLPKP